MNQINLASDPYGVEESQLAQRLRLAQALQQQSMDTIQPIYSNRAALAKVLMGVFAGQQVRDAEKSQRDLAERKDAARRSEMRNVFDMMGGKEVAVPQPVTTDDEGNPIPSAGTMRTAPADRMTFARVLAESADPQLQQMGLSMAMKGPSALKWEKAGDRMVGLDESGNVVKEIPIGVSPDARYGKETVSAEKKLELSTVPASTIFTQGKEDQRQQTALSTVPAATRYTQGQENARFAQTLDKPQVIQGPNGEVLTVNPRAGTGAPVLGPDGTPLSKGEKALTETQGNATAFGMRAKSANDVIAELEAKGAPIGGVQGMLAKSNMTNAVAPEWAQKAQQAKLNFMTAVLRKESGAAIPVSEFEAEDKKYFPQPGDSAGVIEQKRQARALAVEALKVQAGPGAKQIGAQGVAKVASDADYAALPSGSLFVGPDGKTRRKP